MTPKLYLYAAALIALLGLGYVVNGWRQDSNELPIVKATLEQERANYAEQARIRKLQDDISTKTARAYETTIADLRKASMAAAGARGPVRLCNRSPSVPAATSPATIAADTSSEGLHETARPSVEPGPDIAQPLYSLALEADECSARLVGLQGWIAEQLAVK